jgi:hypothetical protein
MFSRCQSLSVALAMSVGVAAACAADEQKKDEPATKSGTVVGTLSAKGDNWIEVKADGEEKARKYVPNWVGGAPAQGGGPDKEMVKVIKELKVGSRVRVEWKFEERPRVVKVEVLKPAEGKDTPKKTDDKEGEKKGAVAGTFAAKGDNWIEVKADGEEKARRYFFHMGGTKELRDAIKDTATGSRVRIEWMFLERPRVLKMEVLKAAEKDK